MTLEDKITLALEAALAVLKRPAASPDTPGHVMPDGTVFAGSANGHNLFVTPNDLPELMTFKNAEKTVAAIAAHGHKDWRIPTREELKILYKNRIAIGNFTTVSGSRPAHWYWSCTEHPDLPSFVYAAAFTDGGDGWDVKDFTSLSCRPIRSQP